MKNSLKGILIAAGAVIALVLLCVGMVQGAQNNAISLEETVMESKSTIDIQQKRRVDLLYNLADCVKRYDEHEAETLIKVIQARGSAIDGSGDNINMQIKAVAEAYPELKSNENYKTFMNELSMTENKIAKVRDNYNLQAKEYKRYVRKFPTRIFLDITGYEIQDFKYLEYNAPEDAPRNLFGD